MKFIFCGDTHVKKDNIESSEKLIAWLAKLADQYKATILFAGDQHDSMGVVRAEVIEFWDKAYKTINQVAQSISITGNHDLSADGLSSAMTAHEFVTSVIADTPFPIDSKNGIWAIGFIRDFQIFRQKTILAYEKGARIIVCHAEFNGAQFENGFYAPHGFNLDAFPEDLMFVSGHIHKKQTLIDSRTGKVKVFYPGTPRMLTRSDIGQIKTVTLWDTDKQSFQDIEVPEEVCPRFQHFIITEENIHSINLIPDSSLAYVDVKGSKDFIQSICKKISQNVKLRTLPDSLLGVNTLKVKESEGIPIAFAKYLDIYKKNHNLTDQEIILIAQLIYDKMPELKVANG